jgi:hypothetical protein
MRSVCVLLLASLFAGLLAAPVPGALKNRKVYFPTMVGTKWEYVDEDGSDRQTREVLNATEQDGGRTISVAMTSSNRTLQIWELREDVNGIYRSKIGGLQLDPPHLLLKANVAPHDSWGGEYISNGIVERYNRVVGEPETITTPAGEFEAIPVLQTNPDDEDDEATVWYAAGIGMVKLKQKNSTALLLKKVTFGK